jgi:hypothetical protein
LAVIRIVAISTSSEAAAHNDFHSAYRNAAVRIEYRWHPLHGQRLPIVQRFTKGELDLYWLEEQPGRSRVVPTWMCDAAACIGMAELGLPLVAVEALGRLAALLKVTADGQRGRASSGALPVEEASDAESSTAENATVARSRSKATAPVRAGSGGGGAGPGRPAAGGPGAGSQGARRRR